MFGTIFNRPRIPFATACLLAISLLVATGCGDDGSMASQVGKGQIIITMHDVPVDSFKEIWMTVESATLISAENEAELPDVDIPIDPLRVDFLSLDSVAAVLAAAQVNAGMYSKLRLNISDPEFVRDDDTVFTEPDVMIVANGHVDVNFQGGLNVIPGTITAVDLDLNLENSIQVNETGNGRYILRPQILVDLTSDSMRDVVVEDAIVVGVNLEGSLITIAHSGSEHTLVVDVTDNTEIMSSLGVPVVLGAVAIGSDVDVRGELDPAAGILTAEVISINL